MIVSICAFVHIISLLWVSLFEKLFTTSWELELLVTTILVNSEINLEHLRATDNCGHNLGTILFIPSSFLVFFLEIGSQDCGHLCSGFDIFTSVYLCTLSGHYTKCFVELINAGI